MILFLLYLICFGITAVIVNSLINKYFYKMNVESEFGLIVGFVTALACPITLPIVIGVLIGLKIKEKL